MEKETKRILQLVLETMHEQQSLIRALERSVMPATRNHSDGIADRIERIAREVRDLEGFATDGS